MKIKSKLKHVHVLSDVVNLILVLFLGKNATRKTKLQPPVLTVGLTGCLSKCSTTSAYDKLVTIKFQLSHWDQIFSSVSVC